MSERNKKINLLRVNSPLEAASYSMPQSLPVPGGQSGGIEAGAVGLTSEAFVVVRACDATVAAPKPATARERTKTRIMVFFIGKSP
jgi:hypothetical protein